MDMKDINSQNLLFLLSAAPLSLGCIITSGDDTATSITDTNGVMTGSGTGMTSGMTGSGTGMPTGMTSGMSSGMADGSSTASVDTTSADTDEPVTYCEVYAALYGECYGDNYIPDVVADCDAYTDELYTMFGEKCVTLFEDLLACLNGLTCDELALGEACIDEDAALEAACPLPKK